MTIDQFNTLNQNHLPEFRMLAMSLTRDGDRARDLLQEVNYQVFKNRNSFRYGTDFSGWVKRIIRNVFISDYRRTKRREDIIKKYGLPASWTGERTVANTGVEALEAEDLMSLIDQLPQIYRDVFILHLRGLSYQETAARCGIPSGTVKSRLFMARSLLKKRLCERNVSEPLRN